MAKVQIGFPQVGKLFTDHLSLLKVRPMMYTVMYTFLTHNNNIANSACVPFFLHKYPKKMGTHALLHYFRCVVFMYLCHVGKNLLCIVVLHATPCYIGLISPCVRLQVQSYLD